MINVSITGSRKQFYTRRFIEEESQFTPSARPWLRLCILRSFSEEGHDTIIEQRKRWRELYKFENPWPDSRWFRGTYRSRYGRRAYTNARYWSLSRWRIIRRKRRVACFVVTSAWAYAIIFRLKMRIRFFRSTRSLSAGIRVAATATSLSPVRPASRCRDTVECRRQGKPNNNDRRNSDDRWRERSDAAYTRNCEPAENTARRRVIVVIFIVIIIIIIVPTGVNVAEVTRLGGRDSRPRTGERP